MPQLTYELGHIAGTLDPDLDILLVGGWHRLWFKPPLYCGNPRIIVGA